MLGQFLLVMERRGIVSDIFDGLADRAEMSAVFGWYP
jgi:hypothetical protein